MPAPRVQPAFRCPICESAKYVQVSVRRPDGHWYRTAFYECFGCSAMFTDPVKFSGNLVTGDGVDRSPRVLGPGG